MARLIGFRSRRARVPAFEEALARLSEELTLTERFADAMVRDGHYKAAIGAIDEQRRRLADAQKTMVAAFRPRFRRLQVALGGTAAVLALAGGSFAAVATHAQSALHSAPGAIQAATEKIARATRVSDDRAGAEIVSAAIADLTEAAGIDSPDPGYRDQLRLLVEGKLQAFLSTRAGINAIVAPQLRELAKRLNVKVRETPVTPLPSPSRDDATPPPQPPAAP